jgi:hypothetical protein
MKITPDVFEAYLKCPTKCWLSATDEPSTGASYSEWLETQNDSYRLIGTRRLVAEFSNNEVVLSPDMENFKVAKWRLASNLAVQAQMDCCVLESEIHALEWMPAEGPSLEAASNAAGREVAFSNLAIWTSIKITPRNSCDVVERCRPTMPAQWLPLGRSRSRKSSRQTPPRRNSYGFAPFCIPMVSQKKCSGKAPRNSGRC